MADPQANGAGLEPSAESAPDYAFDGYEVVFSVKVGLTPPSKPGTGAAPGSAATP